MKNLGGEAFLTFLAYFYPKLGGGEVYQSWGEKYTRSVSLRNLCDYPPPPPGRQYKREGKVH